MQQATTQNEYKYPDTTLLVTHYNRSSSLERLLRSFSDLHCHFGNIIVSDDGSKPEHIEKIRSLQSNYTFQLITTPINKGLGNNMNKGQEAVSTPYTLYVQEDFVPYPIFPSKLNDALHFMQTSPEMDIVRFYAYFRYPYLTPVSNGFSKMNFRLLSSGYYKFYMYSDHPHLRRTSFPAKFGRYTEGTKGDVTEYNMMMSFLQKKGTGLFYEDYKGLFDQANSSDEPSTMKRNYWRQSENFMVTFTRHLYRHLKLNYNYFFSKY
ncbi:MAG: glycosyltransferase [Taibaiella sp.]|nr:glycosyltransferase [Taibaiella sp.]